MDTVLPTLPRFRHEIPLFASVRRLTKGLLSFRLSRALLARRRSYYRSLGSILTERRISKFGRVSPFSSSILSSSSVCSSASLPTLIPDLSISPFSEGEDKHDEDSERRTHTRRRRRRRRDFSFVATRGGRDRIHPSSRLVVKEILRGFRERSWSGPAG